MHGTWLNGEKVPGDKDTAIHDGDLVTFGAQVIRGTGMSQDVRPIVYSVIYR